MSKKVTIGAPSITKQDVNAIQKKVFGDQGFPTTKLLTNLTGRPLLTPVCVLEKHAKEQEVTFQTNGSFVRFFSDIESLAELNGWSEAVVISDTYTDESKAPSLVGDFVTLRTAYENDPEGLDNDQLFQLANAFGVSTRSTNTESWLRENIDRALSESSDNPDDTDNKE
ncbi:MAG: hypothetical protein DSY80_04840 [Desulfocapsa sp.]|nr:MAG: hypothetical protein DSY80_04840 [Desulfocapsa sp.]